MATSCGARPRRLTQQGEILALSIAGRSNRLVFSQSRREMDLYRAELSRNGNEARGSIPLIASSRFDRFPRYFSRREKDSFRLTPFRRLAALGQRQQRRERSADDLL